MATTATDTADTQLTLGQRFAVWKTAYNTANLPQGMTRPPDAISKWLVITRAAVFSMTATSGLIGGLLAVGAARLTGDVSVDWGLLLLAVVGLVVAHAANNMINDYFDLEGGVDTDDYVRALYAPHPILSGWVSKRQLGTAILLVNAIDLAIMAYLAWVRGPLVIAFALAGLFISVFYVAPPIRLKHIGLGEPGVFIVWGPLMTVGTFFVATGAIPGWVWIASLPYAILVTTVLFGKHIDKIDADTKKGVRTLPVILGETRARAVARILMIAFYPIVVGAALVGWIGPWVALVLLGLPKLISTLRTFSAPRPESPPHSYVGWPLWFVGAAFVHTRRAGALLILGLLLNAIVPIRLPWL
ncbi:MAG TPA: prenyltransferase [Candidatus Limnocylindrales bacterium]|nr:prenyltransferase [Candidatus Limnocylindrales bacterium]